ncbi:hypothetical protein FGU71_07720 [Erythrobacter insulae]|uniref:Uncharacterized protein n=1 Tax=Erythrobacter insulae TaxID=2584124 RepID=A0A547PCB8_9SPHN|nr:hypothetical protein [Erythrobacter insulae]TRD11765.1 hypothetical protein FGU71_07720 [Erythrobacter insulae]
MTQFDIQPDDLSGHDALGPPCLHLIKVPEAREYTWLSLKNGRTAPFRPAVHLDEAFGFAQCRAFGDYGADEYDLCMEKHLA